MRHTLAIGMLVLFAGVTSSCESVPHAKARSITGIRPADTELRDALKQLTKSHNDRVKLAMYVSMPFLHRVHPDVRGFTDAMGKTNKAFANDYAAYAQANGVDLSFRYGEDLFGQAQKRMDDSQGDLLRASSGDLFQTLVLNLMYVDYHFGKALIGTILAQTTDLDPSLRDLLERDLKMHDEGIRQISLLMARLKP